MRKWKVELSTGQTCTGPIYENNQRVERDVSSASH